MIGQLQINGKEFLNVTMGHLFESWMLHFYRKGGSMDDGKGRRRLKMKKELLLTLYHHRIADLDGETLIFRGFRLIDDAEETDRYEYVEARFTPLVSPDIVKLMRTPPPMTQFREESEQDPANK